MTLQEEVINIVSVLSQEWTTTGVPEDVIVFAAHGFTRLEVIQALNKAKEMKRLTEVGRCYKVALDTDEAGDQMTLIETTDSGEVRRWWAVIGIERSDNFCPENPPKFHIGQLVNLAGFPASENWDCMVLGVRWNRGDNTWYYAIKYTTPPYILSEQSEGELKSINEGVIDWKEGLNMFPGMEEVNPEDEEIS